MQEVRVQKPAFRKPARGFPTFQDGFSWCLLGFAKTVVCERIVMLSATKYPGVGNRSFADAQDDKMEV